MCGLWPYDSEIFGDSDFMASAVTEEPMPVAGPSEATQVDGPSAATQVAENYLLPIKSPDHLLLLKSPDRCRHNKPRDCGHSRRYSCLFAP
ncbi:hypothetical protein LSAT2_032789, partial [Lamellibrachia satsuma]